MKRKYGIFHRLLHLTLWCFFHKTKVIWNPRTARQSSVDTEKQKKTRNMSCRSRISNVSLSNPPSLLLLLVSPQMVGSSRLPLRPLRHPYRQLSYLISGLQWYWAHNWDERRIRRTEDTVHEILLEGLLQLLPPKKGFEEKWFGRNNIKSPWKYGHIKDWGWSTV